MLLVLAGWEAKGHGSLLLADIDMRLTLVESLEDPLVLDIDPLLLLPSDKFEPLFHGLAEILEVRQVLRVHTSLALVAIKLTAEPRLSHRNIFDADSALDLLKVHSSIVEVERLLRHEPFGTCTGCSRLLGLQLFKRDLSVSGHLIEALHGSLIDDLADAGVATVKGNELRGITRASAVP